MTPERLAEIREMLGGPTPPDGRGAHPIEDAADDLLAALIASEKARERLQDRINYSISEGLAIAVAHPPGSSSQYGLVTRERHDSWLLAIDLLLMPLSTQASHREAREQAREAAKQGDGSEQGRRTRSDAAREIASELARRGVATDPVVRWVREMARAFERGESITTTRERGET